MKAVYTAQQVIDEALAGIEDFEKDRYQTAAMYFGRGYREFQLYHSMEIKDSWLPLSSIWTIPLPEDYLGFISVGIAINGEVFSFTKEDKTLLPTKDPLRQALDSDTTETGDIVKAPLYGYNAKSINTKGYFKIDIAQNRIVLKDNFLEMFQNSDREEVLLRYTSSGIGNLRETYIPGMAANMLISYIEWKLAASRPKQYAMNFIQMKEREYNLECSKFDINALPNIDELYDAIYETAGQSARRI